METSKPKNKGGRPEGAMSKLAKEAREKAEQTGLLPHEILLDMARGNPQLVYEQDGDTVIQKYVSLDVDQRRDAAKAAAPYYAPKISTVEVITGVGDDELDAIIKRAAAEAGVSLGSGGEGEEGEAPPPEARRTRVSLTS